MCIRDRLAIGVVLMAAMGIAEGLVPLAIKPALDVVLNPQSSLQKLVLFQIPFTNRIVYMNDFVPSRVHHVWSVFALALLFIFLFKAIAEYFGSTLIQYVGLCSVTDLRNNVYRKVVQQPVGFFHHNPVGRVMSAVISDIEPVSYTHLDVYKRQVVDIQKIIADLSAAGIGVLVTDHNVRETLAVTNRAYIISDGKILFAGTPKELSTNAEVRRIYLGEGFRLN